MASLLASLFVTERHRQRASDVGHSIPLITEAAIGSVEPLLATSMRGEFLETRRAVSGYSRCGFTHCPVAEEARLIRSLHQALLQRQIRWRNVMSTVADAVWRMGDRAAVVVGATSLAAPDGLHKVELDLGEGCALVLGMARECGRYTRVGDYAALLCLSADRSMTVVAGSSVAV